MFQEYRKPLAQSSNKAKQDAAKANSSLQSNSSIRKAVKPIKSGQTESVRDGKIEPNQREVKTYLLGFIITWTYVWL